MIGLRALVGPLELYKAFGTLVGIGLCCRQVQLSRLGERDASTILAKGLDGQALELRLCHSLEDMVEIAIEPVAGQSIIFVRCHDSHTGLVRGAPPPTIIL